MMKLWKSISYTSLQWSINKLRKYDSATYAYSQLFQIIRKYEHKVINRYTWGLLWVPMINDRRKITTMLENLQSIIDYICVQEPKDQISTTYSFETDKWISPEAAKLYIHSLKFFNRYPYDIFIEHIFPYIKLQKYKTKDLVVYTNNGEVHVILIGDVIMKSHESQVYPSRMMARYSEGDVIGSQFDTKESLKIENWWSTRCLTITAKIPSKQFSKIISMRSQTAFLMIPVLQSSRIFKPLTKLTMFKVFSIIKRKSYTAGSLITAQSK